jgi:hypothetical protein
MPDKPSASAGRFTVRSAACVSRCLEKRGRLSASQRGAKGFIQRNAGTCFWVRCRPRPLRHFYLKRDATRLPRLCRFTFPRASSYRYRPREAPAKSIPGIRCFGGRLPPAASFFFVSRFLSPCRKGSRGTIHRVASAFCHFLPCEHHIGLVRLGVSQPLRRQ